MWGELLTQQVQRDAAAAIEKVRFRSSTNGGQPWAKPIMLDQALRRAKARANDAADARAGVDGSPSAYRTLITMQGINTNQPESLLVALMEQVAAKVGFGLNRSATPHPGTREWREVRSATGAWTGRIEVQWSDVEEVRSVFRGLHGCGVELDGTCYVVELSSDYVQLDVTSAQSHSA